MATQPLTRRPLTSRSSRWAIGAARWLTRLGVRPNQISMASVVFAALAGACLCMVPRVAADGRVWLYVAAAVGIQLRLLCNLLDGMVAIEGGLGSSSGEVFNDFPDRFSDVLILASAGYSISWIAWGHELGWSAAVLALLTAYARVLGGSLGLRQDFSGPMAKPHRMAVLTVACLGSAAETILRGSDVLLTFALALIVIGSLITVVRRTAGIVRQLGSGKEKSHVQRSGAKSSD